MTMKTKKVESFRDAILKGKNLSEAMKLSGASLGTARTQLYRLKKEEKITQDKFKALTKKACGCTLQAIKATRI